MSKHGMNGTPPGVGVSNNRSGSKKLNGRVVDIAGKPMDEAEKHDDEAPVLDPRITHMGSFAIPQAHLRSRFDDIQRFMSDIVIISADLKMTPQGNLFIYCGISPKYFKAVPDGMQVPQYTVAMRLDGVFEVQQSTSMASDLHNL